MSAADVCPRCGVEGCDGSACRDALTRAATLPPPPGFLAGLGVSYSPREEPSEPPERLSIHDPVHVLIGKTNEILEQNNRIMAMVARIEPRLDVADQTLAAHRQAFLEVKSIMTAVMLTGEGSQNGLSGKVLLMVEDEPHLRRAYRKELSAAGAAVHTARDAHEALIRLREMGNGRLDAAYIDVHLGNESVNGVALARDVKRLRPSCKIVLITGGHGEGLAAAAAELGGTALTKPIDLAGLKSALFVE